MRAPSKPFPIATSRPLRRLAVIAAACIAAVLSCGREPTGPRAAAVRVARDWSFRPVFPTEGQQPLDQASGGAVVDFTHVHVVLHHSDGTIALDTTIDFPTGSDAVTMTFDVSLLPGAPAAGEPMTLNLGYINGAGVTVYSGGPSPVLATPSKPGSPAPAPVTIPVTYTGPGSTATRVRIAPRSGSAIAGATFNFVASAQDAAGAAITDVPVFWSSLDVAVASPASVTSGAINAHGVRGTARIKALLPTGAADTVTLGVTLPASTLALISGNGQTGTVFSPLGAPLVVRATASDGVGVAGVTVTFAAAALSGSVGAASVTTDANGFAQTTWTLGSIVGTQGMTASAGGLTGSPVTFSASATAAAPARLVVATQPTSITAGATLPVVTFTAQDASGNATTTFSGAVTVSLGNNPGSATLTGTTTVNAVAGVAAFTGLSVNRVGAAYTLIGSSSGLASATTIPFDVVVGAPNKLVFTQNPANALVGASLGIVQVVAQDVQGNQTPAFTGQVQVAFGSNPGAGVLGGTTTATAVAGVATFSGLSVNRAAAGYTLQASASGLASGTSAAFTISPVGIPGVATQLAFSVQPSSAVAGVAIAPAIVVQARDAFNTLVATFTGNVTLAFGANPGASTLSGTLTVAAVAGVATFSTVSLNHSTVGYTLVASSGALAPATSAAFPITAGAAATLAISGGNGQTAAASAALPTPLAVTVTDANANVVPGITVNWAVVTGGGTVGAPTSVTNALGVATITWTLGAPSGAQSATATVAGLAGSPATFTATAIPAGFTKTWTGAAGTTWTTAGSWSPAGVPTPTDAVYITATTNNPVLSSSITLAALTLAPGATLSIGVNVLTINGNLDAGTNISGTGGVMLPGTGTLKGTFNVGVTVSGTYTLAGTTTITGNLSLWGLFTVGGQTLNVTGIMGTTFNSGVLRMTNALDVVNVNGNVSFAGGDETGQLTAGTLSVTGNFQQIPNYVFPSFVATSGHTTVLNGTAPQTVTFQSPGAAISHFGTLTLSDSATLLASDVYVRGQLVLGTRPATFNRIGSTTAAEHVLTSEGASLRAFKFDNVRWAIVDGTTVTSPIDSVQFTNISNLTAAQFSYNRTVATNATLQYWNFQTAPTAPGVYIQLTGPSTLTMVSPTPASNAGLISIAGGGAIVGWPSVTTATFTGVNVSSTGDWSDPLNWSTGVVPGPTTDVILPSGTPFNARTTVVSTVNNMTVAAGAAPQVGTTGLVVNGDLTVAAGGTVNVNGGSVIAVNGNVIADPTSATLAVSGCNTGSGLTLLGTAKTVKGRFCNVLVTGTYSLSDSLIVPNVGVNTGTVSVSSGIAILTLSGHRISSDRLVTVNGATLTMTNPNDSVIVNTTAIFLGASTMTAGNLIFAGNVQVTGQGLDASGTHTTTFSSTAAAQSITWTTPVAGHGLNHVTFTGAGAKSFSGDQYILGNVTIGATVTTALSGSYNIYVGGNIIDQTLIANGGWQGSSAIHFTGTPTIIPTNLLVNNITFQGGATVTLPNNVNTNYVIVDGAGTNLKLNGHRLKTNGNNFTTQNGATLEMTVAGDSLDATSGGVFFNGGSTSGLLTTGGIATGSVFQGYANTTTLAGGSATSFAPSGSNRVWLLSGVGETMIFANPGTGAGGSHFNSLRNVSASTARLYSDIFVDDSLYLDSPGLNFNSDQLSTAGATRLITTKGLGDNPGTNGVTFSNVSLKFVDGQAAPTYFQVVTWTNFPAAFTGSVFEIARTSGVSTTQLGLHNFTSVVASGLGAGGEYATNTGTLNGWSFTIPTGLLAFILNAGQHNP